MSSEDIENLQKSKSIVSAGKFFAESFKSVVLNPNEELTDENGAFFTNQVYLQAIDSRNTLNEMMMFKQETNVSTSVLAQTLLSKLDSDELSNILAYPSEGRYILGFPKKDLMTYAVMQDNNPAINKLSINKKSYFLIDNEYKFALDLNVDIYVDTKDLSKENTAKFSCFYDFSDVYIGDSDRKSPIVITNEVIKTVDMNIKNNETEKMEEYLLLELVGRNMERSVYEEIINSNPNQDFNVPYKDKLYAFELWYKERDTDEYSKLFGYPKGSLTKDGFEYILDSSQGQRQVQIRFSKLPDGFIPKEGGYLKTIIYTTLGEEGNLNLKNGEENSAIFFTLNPDNTIVEQTSMSNIRMVSMIKSYRTVNGRNQSTHDEIREHILTRGLNNTISTNAEFDSVCNSYNFYNEKVKSDISLKKYRVGTDISDIFYGIVTSGTNQTKFDMSDIPKDPKTNTFIIRPDMYFEKSDDDNSFRYVKDAIPFNQYIPLNRLGKYQITFPYFLYCQFTDKIETKVYNSGKNVEELTSSVYTNTKAIDNPSIEKIKFERNPITFINTTSSANAENKYFYTFTVEIGLTEDTILNYSNSIDDPTYSENNKYVKVKLVFSDATSNGSIKYIFNDTFGVNYNSDSIGKEKLSFTFFLFTNDIIENEKLNITNNTLLSYPVVSETETNKYLSLFQNVNVQVYFKDEENWETRNLEYDSYLKPSEYDEKYVIATDVTISNPINLCEELTEVFNIPLKENLAQTNFLKYDQDTYQMYDRSIPQLDVDGIPIWINETITNPDGTTSTIQTPVYTHKKGEFILDSNGEKILEHSAGDVKFGSDNLPIVESFSKFAVMNYMPWVDRLYMSSNAYFDIINIIGANIDNFKSLQNRLIDGLSVNLVFKNTNENSNEKYYAVIEKSRDKVLLKSCLLHIRYNVRLLKNSNLYNSIDLENISESIIKYTDKYIKENDIEMISMNDIIEYIKRHESNIDFMSCIELNEYRNGEVQTIYNDISKKGSKINVKTIIDLKTSENQGNGVWIYNYVKDIDISFINN